MGVFVGFTDIRVDKLAPGVGGIGGRKSAQRNNLVQVWQVLDYIWFKAVALNWCFGTQKWVQELFSLGQ